MDLQNASMWKRISAFLFDGILLSVLAVAFIYLMSLAVGYDAQNEHLQHLYDDYESRYGVTFEITAGEYEALSPQNKADYDAAYKALSEDREVLYTYNLVVNLTLIVTTVGILLGYLALEFFVPLLLGDGQTLGKKIFAIALVRTDCVRVTALQLFVRTVLGKFTLETMIPVYVIIMLLFNTVGLGGTLLLGALLLTQVILLAATRTRSAIHDLLAGTVAVDLASQRIFRDTDDRIEYQKRIAAEEAARKPY